jgi:hypothetical protein
MKDQNQTEGFKPHLAPARPPAAPKRTEAGKHYIYDEPRISASKLAEYVLASPARQRRIAQDCKVTPKLLVAPYREARDVFSTSLTHAGINFEYLLREAAKIKERIPASKWQKVENPRCATALKRIAAIAEQVECQGGHVIHPPHGTWGGIQIAGVYVSVNPELVFSIVHRGLRKVGGVILSTSQDEQFSLDRTHDGHSVGDYLTTLLYQMLEQRFPSGGNPPLHTRCYAMDVARGKVHSAPQAHKRLLKNLEAACEVIAMRWPSIDVDAILASDGPEETV